jgi:beta-glucanase (GH16 family)
LSQGWTRVFNDDFSAPLSQWTIWYGGAYNNELQMYTANNLLLNGGVLNIEAKRENVTGPTTPYNPALSAFQFTSGRIETTKNFSTTRTTPRVRVSARLKLPTGYGMWPAFWTYGDPWPTQGEIDIMEARGNEPDRFSTAYWYGKRSGVNLASGTDKMILAGSDLTACWHLYEMIWEKNTLTYLLDGQVVDVKSGGYIPSMFGKKQRVTLNLAVGGNFFGNPQPSTIVTGTFQADWVKVFTAK